MSEIETCLCGDDDPAGCLHFALDYPWCRPCGEHHRPPECAINEQGQALCSCGCPWDELEPGGRGHVGCCWAESPWIADEPPTPGVVGDGGSLEAVRLAERPSASAPLRGQG